MDDITAPRDVCNDVGVCAVDVARAGVVEDKHRKQRGSGGRWKDAIPSVDSDSRRKTPSEPRASTMGTGAALQGQIWFRVADRDGERWYLGRRPSPVTVVSFAFGVSMPSHPQAPRTGSCTARGQ